MIRSLLYFLVLAVIAVPSVWFGIQASYDKYQFASEEAQRSLEVTEDQSAELDASALRSDTFAYGIIGAVLAAICGFSSPAATSMKSRLVASGVGIVVGGLCGWACAFLGHWFDHAVLYDEPMTYWMKRWALMLAPLGLGTSIAAASAGHFPKSFPDAIVGSLIGVAATTILYCFLQGLVTPLESHPEVYPAYSSNQVLILGISFALMGGICLLMLGRTVADKEGAESELHAENSGT